MGKGWAAIVAGIASVVVAGLVAAAPSRAAGTPCDEAIRAFDAKYDGQQDDAALAAARALSASCPGESEARAISRVAMIFYGRHDFEHAIAAFRDAIRARPDPRMYMSLCGVLSEAKRNVEALETCRQGLKLAKAADDGSPKRHADVVDLGFNVSLVWVRLQPSSCDAPPVIEGFEAFQKLHPDNAFVYQLLGAWAWDCEDDFEKGLALYKKSCALGQEPACEQVRYTESCQCRTRLKEGR